MATLADLLRSGEWENSNNPYSKNLLADALRGSLSNAESLGRGFAVAPIGLVGDINALAREYVTPRLPAKAQEFLSSMPAAPTTEQILSNIPRASNARQETAGMEQLGAAMNPRGPFELAQMTKNMPVGMSIKSVDNLNDVLRPVRESFVPGVEAGKEMIVHHNISPEKLAKVEKVGGMPVPSIAVSNIENPLSNFGDISLIGSKEMAIPSAKNPVFGFDAYTAKAPRIDYQFDAASKKNLTKLFSDVYPQSSYEAEKLAQNWGDREYNKLYREKFLKEEGILPNRKDFKDEWDYSRAVNESVNNRQAQYTDWMNEFDKSLPSAGVDVKERIFKGFTDSGNRKYVPATLENYVKEMKGGAGSEGIMYGAGSLRAVAAPKFKTLNQVKAARENLVTPEQMKPLKEQIDSEMDALSSKLSGLQDQAGYGYSPSDALYEIAQTKNVNLLDKIYKDVPASLKDDVRSFIGNLQKMPSEYFEIKPQRAVQVGEFKGAILPANAPKQSIDYLRNQGLQELYYYSTPEERKELFKKFGPEMFATVPLGMLGTELPEMKGQK